MLLDTFCHPCWFTLHQRPLFHSTFYLAISFLISSSLLLSFLVTLTLQLSSLSLDISSLGTMDSDRSSVEMNIAVALDKIRAAFEESLKLVLGVTRKKKKRRSRSHSNQPMLSSMPLSTSSAVPTTSAAATLVHVSPQRTPIASSDDELSPVLNTTTAVPPVRHKDSTSSNIVMIDIDDAPAPPNLSATNKDSATQPTADKRYPAPWENSPLLDVFSSEVYLFSRKIPTPEHRSPRGRRLVLNENHFTIFSARIAPWLLGTVNSNKFAVDLPHLLSIMANWFDNVSVVQKLNSIDGNLITTQALLDVEQYGSALVFLVDTTGHSLVQKINDVPISDQVKDKINTVSNQSISIIELRKRLNTSLASGYADSSKHFYALLSNILSVILPSYIILTKTDSRPTIYNARILDYYGLSTSRSCYDRLCQTSLQWSSDPSDTACVSFSTEIPFNGYSTHQRDWLYSTLNNIRPIRIDRLRVNSLLNHFIKSDNIPPLTSHLPSSKRSLD